LIGAPDVVLLDEPSASLDPASRQRLWSVIEKHKKSCVMLLTTHSMQEVFVVVVVDDLFSVSNFGCW
jgi:ABC-type multidrug transport system ATPase subunit